MIVGISGKLGSGKDTVGKIIQYLVANNNLPKNMQYRSLEEIDNGIEKFSNWKIKKFAGHLKTIASILTGIPVEKFEDQEFKKTIMPEEWWYFNNEEDTFDVIPYMEDTKHLKNVSYLTLHKTTYREFLQKLGTEAMRDGLHPNTWANAFWKDYKPKWVPTGDSVAEEDVSLKKEYPNWIITDTRFPNEFESVVERGGITIKVVRSIRHQVEILGGRLSDNIPDNVRLSNEHPSETALDNHTFDYVIENDSNIDSLIEKVRDILIKEEIISS